MVVVAENTQARTPEPHAGAAPALLSLDLGSGPYPAAGYVGVDLDPGAAVPTPDGFVFCNLLDGRPWPFDDSSVQRLRAWHFIEHIPHERVVIGKTRVRRTIQSPGQPRRNIQSFIDVTQDAFFWFFDECHRIAAPGCRFELAWPHPDCDAADQDPTHARRVRPSTLRYLSRETRARMGVSHYPAHCNWELDGDAQELGDAAALEPFRQADGSIDVAAARRARGVFTECRAVLIKPILPETKAP